MIYDHGCNALDHKALTNGFSMTLGKTVVFVKAFQHHTDGMGWTTGTKQISTFTNRAGKSIDIIKDYGQICKATLKTTCERFWKAGGVDVQSRAKQNNTMMF